MLVKNDFGVWQIDLTVEGERCRKSTRTKDKALAQKLHALTESEMLKGTWGSIRNLIALRVPLRMLFSHTGRVTRVNTKYLKTGGYLRNL